MEKQYDPEDMDEPREIISVGYQMLIGALTMLFSVPFGTSFDIRYFEEQAGVEAGSWWYVGVIFILGTTLAMFMFLIIREHHAYVALVRTLTSLVFMFVFGLFINSLWQHGTLIWVDYFESYKVFFTSDIIISITSGLTVSGISVFIPQEKEKAPSRELKNYCDEEGVCYFPSPKGVIKVEIEDVDQSAEYVPKS